MSAANTTQPKKPNRSSRWSTRQLAAMALFTALGIILSFLEPSIIPGFEFLKYDASSVTALLCGLSFGPAAGSIVGVVTAWIHALISGNIWGAVMNTGTVLAFVLPASIAYKRSQTTAALIVGLVISCVCMIIVALLMNLVVTPIYTGMPLDAVIALLPVLLLFNSIKVVINSILSFIAIKSLKSFLK